MTIRVSVLEVVSQFSELLDRVKQGEEVIISDGDVPVARLLAAQPSLPRVPGQDKGQVIIAPDFDAPLPEDILQGFLEPASPQS